MTPANVRDLILALDPPLATICEGGDCADHPRTQVLLDPELGALLDQSRSRGLGLHMLAADDAISLGETVAKALPEGLIKSPATALFADDATEPGDPAATLLVSGDRVRRHQALQAGMRSIAHPRQARQLLDGQPPVFCELSGPRDALERLSGLVPYDLERQADGSTRVIGSIPPAELARAVLLGLRVRRLDADPARHDLAWFALDRQGADLEQPLSDLRLLIAERGRVLIALEGTQSVDQLPLAGGHGALRLLLPGPELLKRTRTAADGLAGFSATQARLLTCCKGTPELLRPEAMPLDQRLKLELLAPDWPVSDADFQSMIDRYRGNLALDAAGAIASRHVRHPDNARTVSALRAELAAMGLCVWTQDFSHQGKTLKNVIAQMPGRGLLALDPDLLARLRDRQPTPG